MDKITDNGLRSLLKLPNLTCLDFNGKGCTIANNITDVGMRYLERLTPLRYFDLFASMRITEVKVK